MSHLALHPSIVKLNTKQLEPNSIHSLFLSIACIPRL